MVLLAAQGAAHGAELGRLFLSADERNAIDTARQGSADVRQARARASAEPIAEQHAAVLEAPAETVALGRIRTLGGRRDGVGGMAATCCPASLHRRRAMAKE